MLPVTLVFFRYLILCAGAGLRIFHFLDNRSLWRDEAYLALNLMHRGFTELAAFPLDLNQHAPIGFLYTEKAFTLLFGYSEQGLRLFPLLCGIGSLVVFSKLAFALLPYRPALAALTCLAFSNPTIYQSVEVKQYATELLVSVLLFWGWMLYQKKNDFWSKIAWGLAGGVAVWFSYSAVFVLAGLFMADLKPDKPKSFLPAFCWLVSFSMEYIFFISKSIASGEIVRTWQALFVPFPPRQATDVIWLFKAVALTLDEPLGLNFQFNEPQPVWLKLLGLSWIACFFLLGGIYILWLKNKPWLVALVLPMCFIIVASALKKYPFYERFLLFYNPAIFLIIGFGIHYFLEKVQENKIPSKFPQPVFISCLVLLLLSFPLVNSIGQAVYPQRFGGFRRNEFRQALERVAAQKTVKYYLDDSLSELYNYYQQYYPLHPIILIDRNNLKSMPADTAYFIIYLPSESDFIDINVRNNAKFAFEKVQNTMKARHAQLIFAGKEIQVFKE